MTRWRWVAVGGLLSAAGTTGVILFLVVNHVDDVNKWVAVLAPVGWLIGLAGMRIGWVMGRPRSGRRAQQVNDAVVAGPVFQARDVGSSVRIGGAVTVHGDHVAGQKVVNDPRVHRISMRPGPGKPRRPRSLSPQDPGFEAFSNADPAGQPDTVTQTGRKLPTHDRDSRLRDLAVSYGEQAVVQALRDTAGVLAVVARTGAEAAS